MLYIATYMPSQPFAAIRVLLLRPYAQSNTYITSTTSPLPIHASLLPDTSRLSTHSSLSIYSCLHYGLIYEDTHHRPQLPLTPLTPDLYSTLQTPRRLHTISIPHIARASTVPNVQIVPLTLYPSHNYKWPKNLFRPIIMSQNLKDFTGKSTHF